MRNWKILLSFVLAMLMGAISATNVSAASFYEGKTMTVIVATKPGGGYDFYGRLLARFMGKYLPIKTIIVKNLPGAGHIIGVNKLYAAKPDGLTIGLFTRALVASQIAGVKGLKLDFAKLSWLGSPAADPRALVVAKNAPYKNLDDLVNSEKPINFAATGIGGMDYLEPVVLAKIFKAKNWTIATGYGGGESQLALMRGEITAKFASWSSMISFVRDGEAHPVMFTSETPIEGYENVPLLPGLVGDEYKGIVDLMIFFSKLARTFAGPPGIPADRLKELRDAFEKTWQDPELLKMAEKSDRPISFTGASVAQKLVESALRQPADVKKMIQKAYREK